MLKVDDVQAITDYCRALGNSARKAARVSGGCFVMGQAAGTAAALAIGAGVRPRELEIRALQDRLEADGAYLGRVAQ